MLRENRKTPESPVGVGVLDDPGCRGRQPLQYKSRHHANCLDNYDHNNAHPCSSNNLDYNKWRII